jgi:hypothetical protein
MISTIQNHFPILFLSIVSRQKTVIYDKEGNEVKVVNEVALNEIMPKGFMAAPVKEIWIGEMTRQLHCTMLKLLMRKSRK